jgi:hypothetical protein
MQHQPAFWVEKTARGQAYRWTDSLALGRALVSPSASASGGDIYRTMREVIPGDVVLHLEDNEAFLGYSVVAAPYNEFTANGKLMYRVPLRDHTKLSHPLSRTVLFSEPYREQLLGLAERGLRSRFYTRQMRFTQGSYLTRAPRPLMEILDAAYLTIAGTSMSDEIGARTAALGHPVRP